MAADNNLEPRGVGREVDLAEIVKDVHSYPVDLEGFRRGKVAGPWLPIHVASHGLDRGHRAQALEDRRLPDVAGVDDQVDTAERRQGLRPQEAVGIRDHTEASLTGGPSHKGHKWFHQPLLFRSRV
jgi:hypothetical protein